MLAAFRRDGADDLIGARNGVAARWGSPFYSTAILLDSAIDERVVSLRSYINVTIISKSKKLSDNFLFQLYISVRVI